MKYILAIDQGTTGSRAIAFDKDGVQVASAYREFPQYYPRPGWVEHDPVEIWESVRASIESVLEQVPPDSIEGIGITNQRETTLVWDRETGEPVHHAIVWQCRRTAERCEQLGRKDFFHGRTGLPVDAYFSATKIEWILRNVPGAAEKASQGRLLFGTTDSWILWKLTGGKVHATDYTNASRTMLMNIETLEWDEEILRIFSISREILPEIRRSSEVVGETVKIGSLPAGIPIAGIAGDQQSALFGQACFEPGTIKNTYGTGSFILMNAGRERPISSHGLIVTIACGPTGEPVYALEGAVFIAGAALQWLRDGLGILESAADSEQIARSVPDNGGVYFVPALVGLGAPYWDQNARGSIHGITRGTTSAHLVRAALEAICYQTCDVFEAMQTDSGLQVGSLKVDGGSASNDFLCQFQADMLGIDVIRPKTVETTSLGAAYLAGLALGYWKDADDIRRCWHEDRVFKPAMPRAQAAEFYAAWQNAVHRTLTRD